MDTQGLREKEISSIQDTIERNSDLGAYRAAVCVAFSNWDAIARRIPGSEPLTKELSGEGMMPVLLLPVVKEGKFTASTPLDFFSTIQDQEIFESLETLRNEGFVWVSQDRKDAGLTSKGLANVLHATFEVMAEGNYALNTIAFTRNGAVFPNRPPKDMKPN